jgi:hypothetical protein
MSRFRRVSSKRPDVSSVVREYVPDLARQVQALLVVLRACEGDPGPAPQHTSVPAALAAVPGRSNAPAAETPGASTDIGTVTSSAINKQGCTDDTTTRP